MREVIVIGGGAAGLAAAAAAAKRGAKVTVLEKNDRCGKKLLAAGNGRCNISNTDPHLFSAYQSHDPIRLAAFEESLLCGENREAPLRFFRELGLLTAERDGYLYPRSMQSQSVLQVLLCALSGLHVRIRTRTGADRIDRDPETGRLRVFCGSWHYETDAVILCAGSKASPQLGAGPEGYMLAEQTGHEVTELVPGLCPILCEDPLTYACAGDRVHAVLTLLSEDTGVLCREEGQLQWTAGALSGIPAFNLSRLAGEQEEGLEVELDLVPEMSEDDLAAYLRRVRCLGAAGEAASPGLAGLFPPRTAAALSERLPREVFDAARMLKHLRLRICGVRSFDSAQICCGGIALSQFDPRTMESLVFPGLYAAGEVLDADGPCGGYNLHWAFASGLRAGECSAQDPAHETGEDGTA